MDLTFAVQDWCAWGANVADADCPSRPGNHLSEAESRSPDVSSIPPLLRRRLSLMGRSAVCVMLPLFEQYGPMPIVYCSRHGEIRRTMDMLKSLADAEPLSPTAFSLSVHNALCGLFSIHQKAPVPVTAIAAGAEDLIPVILEGAGQSQQAGNILCVFCDEPLPKLVGSDLPPAKPYATAFVLSQGREFALAGTDPEATAPPPVPQALQFLQFLNAPSAKSLTLNAWQIRRL